MKETDIVQALRCCAEGECKDCAMHEDKQRCQENLLDKAAEAIERLTAENAALREEMEGKKDGSHISSALCSKPTTSLWPPARLRKPSLRPTLDRWPT